jgi:hypothetical protein
MATAREAGVLLPHDNSAVAIWLDRVEPSNTDQEEEAEVKHIDWSDPEDDGLITDPFSRGSDSGSGS